MSTLSRVHGDDRQCTPLRQSADFAGHPETFCDDDLAGHVHCVPEQAAGEHLIGIVCVSARLIHQRRVETFLVDGAHGHRLGVEGAASNLNVCLSWDAQVQVRSVYFHGYPMLPEPLGNQTRRCLHVNRIFAFQGGEAFNEFPGGFEIDGIKNSLFVYAEHAFLPSDLLCEPPIHFSGAVSSV